ncbi:hypothetical protein [Streptomyces sp. NPDC055085]
MSTKTLPRHAHGLGGYWCVEHPNAGRHCTLPVGHRGGHWHVQQDEMVKIPGQRA